MRRDFGRVRTREPRESAAMMTFWALSLCVSVDSKGTLNHTMASPLHRAYLLHAKKVAGRGWRA